jgi:5'-nucleotidase
MPFPIEKKLVIAVSATALFDLEFEHNLYLKLGTDKFRAYQRENRHNTPNRGAAFPFIQRLLSLNEAYPVEKPVEVVILSRHHADAGLRIMDAVRAYGLDISRSFFLAGTLPFPYMKAINSVLYLSTNEQEVRIAVQEGFPAGQVLPCKTLPSDEDKQLRIAFDFDGVLVDDEAEKIYSDSNNLNLFHKYEQDNCDIPLHSGPLMPLLQRISQLQKLERQKAQNDNSYTQMLRIAIVTARNAPAHERLVNTLSSLEIETDELFLMGGIEKKLVLDILKPHIFFDDQLGHLTPACDSTPSVHIPFGVANPDATKIAQQKAPPKRVLAVSEPIAAQASN